MRLKIEQFSGFPLVMIKQILDNQENAEKYNELIKLSFTNDHIQLDDALEKILQTIQVREKK